MEKLKNKVYLSSPTMHGDELKYMKEAFETNWMSTVGENIEQIETLIPKKIGIKYGVALSSGTSALHLCMILAGIKKGDYVFCSDMTFSATVNPIVYAGGIPIFIDSETETWNIDPNALEKAFELYPNVKFVVVANLYGTPCKMDEILSVCRKHNATLIEDAAESFGAIYKGRQTGSFGSYNIISFNGNKIITGSSGGMLLTDNIDYANRARKLSTQARENAQWYQHEEIGYNYRMSNVIAGVIRGQIPYLEMHIKQKKEIYYRYKEGLKGLPVKMNPFIEVRSDNDVCFVKEKGKSCPTEILNKLSEINAEGRPIWKPMHMQPIYRMNPFVTKKGNARGKTNAYIPGKIEIIDEDIFDRGLCLPSDNKMTKEEQEIIIEVIKSCFR